MIPYTIQFGTEFFSCLDGFSKNIICKNTFTCYPFIDWKLRPTMDMGIVSKCHLQFIKINEIYSLERLKELKIFLIENENVVLGLSPVVQKKITNNFD